MLIPRFWVSAFLMSRFFDACFGILRHCSVEDSLEQLQSRIEINGRSGACISSSKIVSQPPFHRKHTVSSLIFWKLISLPLGPERN